MNATAATKQWARRVIPLLVLVACAAGANGQSADKDPIPPLYVGNRIPVLDQYGRPLRGSLDASGADRRCRVEIRVAPYPGVRAPPQTNGAPHDINPLVTSNSIGGIGLNAAQPDSGIFCMIFTERLPTNAMIFARVFNAATPAEATFYADSRPVSVSVNQSSVLLEFDPAKPLDGSDDDGDGLVNSWEQVLGTDDRPAVDYDGDGMNDWHEMLAGTDPTNHASLLSLHWVRKESPPPAVAGTGGFTNKFVRLKWQAVPGKRYQIQYALQLTPDPVTGEPREFDLVQSDPIVAGADEAEIDMYVEIPADADTRMFRVRLVPDGE